MGVAYQKVRAMSFFCANPRHANLACVPFRHVGVDILKWSQSDQDMLCEFVGRQGILWDPGSTDSLKCESCQTL